MLECVVYASSIIFGYCDLGFLFNSNNWKLKEIGSILGPRFWIIGTDINSLASFYSDSNFISVQSINKRCKKEAITEINTYRIFCYVPCVFGNDDFGIDKSSNNLAIGYELFH